MARTIQEHLIGNLNLKDIGLLTLINTLGDGSTYSYRQLSTLCGDGIDSITTSVKRLEEEGLLTRTKTPTGKMSYKLDESAFQK